MAGNSQRYPLIGCALVFLLAGLTALPAKDSTRSTRTESASGKFVIYSSDSSRRMALSRRAEDAGSEWNRRFPQDGDALPPIIIQDLIGSARPKGGLPAVTRIFEGDGGSQKVQIDIYDLAVVRSQAFEIEIFRARALQAIYRNQTVRAGKAFRQPPAWLPEGLAEAIHVKENGTPDAVYAAILRSERPPRIEDFLKAKPELLEATSLSIYRTQAMAMVQVLEQLPEAGKGLAKFLESLATSDPGMKTFLAAYPSLENDPSRLSKIWTLALARGSASKHVQLLALKETDRLLSSILDVSSPSDPKKPESAAVKGAAALPLVARAAGGPFAMRQKSAELLGLEMRCHPLLKPIVEEYRNIVTLLASKPKKDVAKRLEEIDKIRSLLAQRSDRVSDYLNWFEATKLDSPSGEFLNITSPLQAPARTDPITTYLDAIEQRGW